MTNSISETIVIPMSRGLATVIDGVDADLAELRWSPEGTKEKKIYAMRYILVVPQIKGIQKRKSKKVSLHRLILERILERPLQAGELCDHVDGEGLNNQRSNLRLASLAQNNQNTKRPKTNKSGFKGVYFDKTNNKWYAGIQANGRRYFLGLFDTVEEAVEVYRRTAQELHGEFARFE